MKWNQNYKLYVDGNFNSIISPFVRINGLKVNNISKINVFLAKIKHFLTLCKVLGHRCMEFVNYLSLDFIFHRNQYYGRIMHAIEI